MVWLQWAKATRKERERGEDVEVWGWEENGATDRLTGKAGMKVDPSGGVTKKVIDEKKEQAPFLGQDRRGSMKWGGYVAHVGRTLLEYPFLWYQIKRNLDRDILWWGKQVDKCMGFDFSQRQPLLNTRGWVINVSAVSI